MKKFLILLLTLVTASAVASPPRSQATIEAEILGYREDIKKRTAMMSEYQGNSRVSERQLSLIQGQRADRERLVKHCDEQIEGLERQIASNRDSLARLEMRLEQIRREYAGMVRQAYVNRLTNNSLTLIFASADFNSAVRRGELLQYVNRARRERAEEILLIEEGLKRGNETLVAQREELQKKRTEREKEYRALLAEEENVKRALEKWKRQVTQEGNTIRAAQQRIEQLQQEQIRAIQQAARATQAAQTAAQSTRPAQSTARTSTQTTAQQAELAGRFEQNKGRLPRPVSGVVGRRFGLFYLPNFNQGIFNRGLTFNCDRKSTVIAVFDGTVSRVTEQNGMKTVTINHGKYFTGYANLATVTVKNGDVISARQVIGTTSNSPNQELWYMNFYILDQNLNEMDPSLWLVR